MSEQNEKPVMRVVEHNRILIIPDAVYAGGIYRTPHDIEVKEWERVHELYASELDKQTKQDKGETKK